MSARGYVTTFNEISEGVHVILTVGVCCDKASLSANVNIQGKVDVDDAKSQEFLTKLGALFNEYRI